MRWYVCPCGQGSGMLFLIDHLGRILIFCQKKRAVPSLTVPGGQEFHFPHFFLNFRSVFLIFPQTLFIFFLILALRVGGRVAHPGRPWLRHTAKDTWMLTFKIKHIVLSHHDCYSLITQIYHQIQRTVHLFIKFCTYMRQLWQIRWRMYNLRQTMLYLFVFIKPICYIHFNLLQSLFPLKPKFDEFYLWKVYTFYFKKYAHWQYYLTLILITHKIV